MNRQELFVNFDPTYFIRITIQWPMTPLYENQSCFPIGWKTCSLQSTRLFVLRSLALESGSLIVLTKKRYTASKELIFCRHITMSQQEKYGSISNSGIFEIIMSPMRNVPWLGDFFQSVITTQVETTWAMGSNLRGSFIGLVFLAVFSCSLAIREADKNSTSARKGKCEFFSHHVNS